MSLSKDGLIEALGLVPHHDEGGYYSEQYRSKRWQVEGGRDAADTIYYMLTDDSPIGHFHKNESDIVHFFHAGSALRYTIIDPQGVIETFRLGLDVVRGEVPQKVVPGGYWKASELTSGTFGLISEVVVPAFTPDQRVIASRSMLEELFPGIDSEMLRLAWK